MSRATISPDERWRTFEHDPADSDDVAAGPYYRGIPLRLGPEDSLFEFVMPLVSPSSNDEVRIQHYKDQMTQGVIPTGLAFSLLDGSWSDDFELSDGEFHWGLGHFLLDGHHKIQAAAQLEGPLDLMTALSLHSGKAVLLAVSSVVKVLHSEKAWTYLQEATSDGTVPNAGSESLSGDRRNHFGLGVSSAVLSLRTRERRTDVESSDGATRLAYILGVPLADDVERQWPQMGEVVLGADLVASVEGNFPELTLAIGRRIQADDLVVVEWTCDYGDGRLYRNVTIGELRDGRAVKVTDYWGEPTATPAWRKDLTAPLAMPGDGIWPDHAHLEHR